MEGMGSRFRWGECFTSSLPADVIMTRSKREKTLSYNHKEGENGACIPKTYTSVPTLRETRLKHSTRNGLQS